MYSENWWSQRDCQNCHRSSTHSKMMTHDQISLSLQATQTKQNLFFIHSLIWFGWLLLLLVFWCFPQVSNTLSHLRSYLHPDLSEDKSLKVCPSLSKLASSRNFEQSFMTMTMVFWWLIMKMTMNDIKNCNYSTCNGLVITTDYLITPNGDSSVGGTIWFHCRRAKCTHAIVGLVLKLRDP